MNKHITTIVFGGSTNAIGQIRASHQAGYECINIVEKSIHSWSRKSKYCKGVIAPHPYNERDACIKFVMDFISKLDVKPFLLFASDEWMDMIGENEAEFRKIAYIPQGSWSEISQLYNKKYLYRIAEENGIPYPKTVEIEDMKELIDRIHDLQAPYIVKPQTTISQNEIAKTGIVTYHRTQKFENEEDLLKWADLLLKNNINFPILIQEFIPGDATKLYTLTSYSDKNNILLAGSVGHKLRQFPPVAGRITSGVLQHDNKLFQLGELFLKKVNYHGLANTEFKLDERDGLYKLMEINTRLGAWNYSTLFAGINLVKVAIEDSLGITYSGPKYIEKKDSSIWYNLTYDLSSVLIMNRKIGEKAYSMNFAQWKKSLGDNSFEAIWDKHDWKPFIYNILYLIKGNNSIKLRSKQSNERDRNQ